MSTGIKIKDLPVAATLNGADLFEVSQSIASVQTSGKITLSDLATYLSSSIGVPLSTVLATGSNTGGNSIDVNNGDSIRLGDSRIGVLDYFVGGPYVRFYHSVTNDYLRFLDAGGINLSSNDIKLSVASTGQLVQLTPGLFLAQGNAAGTAYFSTGTADNQFFHPTKNTFNSPINDVNGNLRLSSLTASTVPYLNASKDFVSSTVTPTELGYVSGVTSAIQTQLNGKINGTVAATAGLITYGTGTADTITGITTFKYDVTNVGLILGTTSMVATTDVAHFYKAQNGGSYFRVKNDNASTGSYAGYIADNGTSTGSYYQAGTAVSVSGNFRPNQTLLTGSGAGGFILYSASNNANAAIYFYTSATERMQITSTGLYVLTNSVASTHNHTLINTSASNGAYCQYTCSNNSAVINIGMVGANTTTSGVYVQGNAYNMTTSTGYSTGTLHASGTYRIYTANGSLALSIDSSQRVGIGIAAGSITAVLHLKAGSATANTAPLQFTSGTYETAARAGVMEYNGQFSLTPTDATRRYIVLAAASTKVTAAAPYTNDGYVTLNINGTDVKIMTTA